MRVGRIILAFVVALSPATLPLAGAFAVPGDEPMASDAVVASAHDCYDDVTAPAATAAAITDTDMPMSGKCNGCENGVLTGCSAFCSSVVAVLPVVAAFGPVSVARIGPSAAPAATGYAFPPDPYPPRPIALN